MPVHPATVEPDAEELLSKQRFIYRIKPEERGGEAFKLIYLVPVSVDVFWRFKTDFRGNFLLSNKYIKKHRVIHEMGNVIITENTSPFKVVLLLFSTRNDFSRRDMGRIFTTDPLGLWFLGTAWMLLKSR